MPLQENRERKRRVVAKRLARPRLEKPQAFLKAEGRRAAKTPVGANSPQRRSQDCRSGRALQAALATGDNGGATAQKRTILEAP